MRSIRTFAFLSTLALLLGAPAFGQGGSGSSRVEPVVAHEQAMETMARVQKMLVGMQKKVDRLAQEPTSPEVEKKMARISRNADVYRSRLSELERDMDTVYRNLMSEQSRWLDEPEPVGAADPDSTRLTQSSPASCDCANKH